MINIKLSLYIEHLSKYKIPYIIGDNISTVCTKVQLYTLEAKVFDTTLTTKIEHNYSWEQIKGAPVVWVTNQNKLIVTIDIDEIIDDRIFRFYVDKGRKTEQYTDLYMFSCPSDILNVTLTSNITLAHGNQESTSFDIPVIENFGIIPIPPHITTLDDFRNTNDGDGYCGNHNNFLVVWTVDEAYVNDEPLSKIIGYDLIDEDGVVLDSQIGNKVNNFFLLNPDNNKKYGISAKIFDKYFKKEIILNKIGYLDNINLYSNVNTTLTSTIVKPNIENFSNLILSKFERSVDDSFTSTLTSSINTPNISNFSKLILSKFERSVDDNLMATLTSSINTPDISNFLVEILTKQEL